MNQPSELSAIYTAPIVLWVEDEVTRVYLQECWRDPDVRVLIAGSSEAVRALVRSAERHSFPHVLGFCDRDFGASNRTKWAHSTGGRVLYPDVHEVENYFLDPDDLAGCALNTRRRTVAEILTALETRAAGMTWSMAYGLVLRELRTALIANYPGQRHVMNQAEAERLVLESSWFKNDVPAFPGLLDADAIRARLMAAHTTMSQSHRSGDWRRDFAGKDLISDWHTLLYQPPAGGPMAQTQDLARHIAQWQVAHGRVPPEVTELRSAIRSRLGLAP